MDRYLGRYSPQLYAILRIVSGLMFALHGTQKLFGFPGDKPSAAGTLMMAGGIIEVVTGLLLALGLFASSAAFLASGEMAVAYFKAHFAVGNPIPNLNRGELAVVYCFLFLYVAAHGAGIWSIDDARRRGVSASTGATRP
jgi:putative oxidoreductase